MCDLMSDWLFLLSTTDRRKAQLMSFPPSHQESSRERSKLTHTQNTRIHTEGMCRVDKKMSEKMAIKSVADHLEPPGQNQC